MPLISYFPKGIRQTKPASDLEPHQIIRMITEGKFSEMINNLRQVTDPAIKTVMKSALPYVTWSGTFKTRNISGLIEHSGLICLDFDHIFEKNSTGTKENIEATRVNFYNTGFVYAALISPSGDGMKVIVKINPAKHASAFLALKEYFLKRWQLKVDESGKDVSRACFLSYDPGCYVQENCKTFNPADPPAEAGVARELPIPNSENAGAQFTRAMQWTNKNAGEYIEGNRNNHLFQFACQCNRLGIPEEDALDFSLATFADIDEKELRKSVNSAYKNHIVEHGKIKPTSPLKGRPERGSLNSGTTDTQLPLNGHTPGNAGSQTLNSATLSTAPLEEFISATDKKRFYSGPFWVKVEDIKEGTAEIKIKHNKLIAFLEDIGFMQQEIKADNGEATYQVIQLTEQKILPVERTKTKQIIKKWLEINKVESNTVWTIMRGAKNYFSKDLLEFLEARDVQFKRDTKDEAFLYFQNCFVRVTADTIKREEYSKLELPIWNSQVIQRPFHEFLSNYTDSEFWSFLACALCGCEDWKKTKNVSFDTSENDAERPKLEAMETAIGYLMHQFKNPSEAYSVNLFDSQMIDKASANGRSGKSLVFDMLNYVKPTSKVPGVTPDITKPEIYAKVNFGTAVVYFDDCKNKFPYDKLFDSITGGLTVKRLYEDIFMMPFALSPKIGLTSNHPLEGEGGSYLGRQKNYVFTSFFNYQYKPSHFFGHNLGSDWDDKQWDLFYSYIIHCIQMFLRKGIIDCKGGEYEENKLRRMIPEEMMEYFDNIERNFQHEQKKLFADFKTEYSDYNDMRQNGFTKKLKFYADYKGLKINPHVTDKKPGNFPSYKIGDVYFVTLATPGTVTAAPPAHPDLNTQTGFAF